MTGLLQKYRLTCTLTFGDIYGQIMIWLIVIFVSLGSAIAMYQNPVYAFLTSGLILVLSVPFLLFAFVTTLLNHIEFLPAEVVVQKPKAQATPMVQPSRVVQPG
jgi:hypothetical protein